MTAIQFWRSCHVLTFHIECKVTCQWPPRRFTKIFPSVMLQCVMVFSAYDYTVPSKGKVLAKTDIQIALPHGCYGRIAPRSGLAHKHFIDVGAGVIDEDYRGNVGVILFNFGEKDFEGRRLMFHRNV